MKGQQQPILVIEEVRIDVLRHAGRLRAMVGDLHRFAVLVFPLIGDRVGLRVPFPASGNVDVGTFHIEGVADSLDLPEESRPWALAILSAIGGRCCAQDMAEWGSSIALRAKMRITSSRGRFIMVAPRQGQGKRYPTISSIAATAIAGALLALPGKSLIGQQYALRGATRDGSIAPTPD